MKNCFLKMTWNSRAHLSYISSASSPLISKFNSPNIGSIGEQQVATQKLQNKRIYCHEERRLARPSNKNCIITIANASSQGDVGCMIIYNEVCIERKKKSGWDGRTRTFDLRYQKPVLYQLSYIPKNDASTK